MPLKKRLLCLLKSFLMLPKFPSLRALYNSVTISPYDHVASTAIEPRPDDQGAVGFKRTNAYIHHCP